MSRLNCDLSGWAGKVILIRFRVVTRTDIANHYDSAVAGFGGIYIDDVKVVGNTTTGGRGAAGPAGEAALAASGGQPVAGSAGDGGQGNHRGAINTSNIDNNRESGRAGGAVAMTRAATVRPSRWPALGGDVQ